MKRKYEASGMGLTSGCFSLGMVFGPMVGGLLANPVLTFPRLFRTSLQLQMYPYLLPNLITALLAMISGLLVLKWLPETLPRNTALNSDQYKRGASVVELLKTPGSVLLCVVIFTTNNGNFITLRRSN